MNRRFITFEGLDGSGKTSVLNYLDQYLKKNSKQNYEITREPGGNQIAERIRQLLLDANLLKMDPWTEALLYAAARRQHLVETVLPALRAGEIVFCDRYVDSSIVYQGAGRQLGEEKIAELNDFATDKLQADYPHKYPPPPAAYQSHNHSILQSFPPSLDGLHCARTYLS